MTHTRDPKYNRRQFTGKAAGFSLGISTLTSGCQLANSSHSSTREKASQGDAYQYIVIGSGAGGGPLACRLAERGYRVALLEAGSDYYENNYKVPAFSAKSTEDPNMTWEFFVNLRTDAETERKNSKYDAEKGGVFYPRGATLGGCTAHNALITMYPDNDSWQNIANLVQDDSFAPEVMTQYFKRMENCQYTDESKIHGKHGWLPTSMTPQTLALKEPKLLFFLKAALKHTGHNLVYDLQNLLLGKGDPNNWKHIQENRTGFYNTPQSSMNGVRFGSREYIKKIQGSKVAKNLTVITEALASKILFNPGKQAIGVEYLKGRNIYQADPRANKSLGEKREVRLVPGGEVILSGGAFNSPQLLKLSGIGPHVELRRTIGEENIIHDAPAVGTNLQDRYEICVVNKLKEPFGATAECTFDDGPDPCLEDWKKEGRNSLYGQNGVIAGLKKKSRPDVPPDFFYFSIPGHFRGYYKGYSKYEETIGGNNMLTWALLKGHTRNYYDGEKGGGTVTLKSSNPRDVPEINFNSYARDPGNKDIDAMVEAVKETRKIMSESSVADRIAEEIEPGPDITDDKLKEFIKQESFGHHASCSNPMGIDPRTSVVDSKFRVHGVKNLRVVDASVFPRIPGLYIVTPVYMISEKAADVISSDANFS